jgi:hypothetical protein
VCPTAPTLFLSFNSRLESNKEEKKGREHHSTLGLRVIQKSEEEEGITW